MESSNTTKFIQFENSLRVARSLEMMVRAVILFIVQYSRDSVNSAVETLVDPYHAPSTVSIAAKFATFN
jgi:hypothetical protein